jgi:hypothetical protein
MLPTFGALFEGINNYAYEPVTAADDDECMICKEPYLKDDSSGADGATPSESLSVATSSASSASQCGSNGSLKHAPT